MFSLQIQPITLTPVRQALKPSNTASTKTLQSRNKFLLDILQVSSGTSKEAALVQTGKLVKSFDTKQRQEIRETANIPSVSIPEDALVAMKVDISGGYRK